MSEETRNETTEMIVSDEEFDRAGELLRRLGDVPELFRSPHVFDPVANAVIGKLNPAMLVDQQPQDEVFRGVKYVDEVAGDTKRMVMDLGIAEDMIEQLIVGNMPTGFSITAILDQFVGEIYDPKLRGVIPGNPSGVAHCLKDIDMRLTYNHSARAVMFGIMMRFRMV
jgi:hypothetical protein